MNAASFIGYTVEDTITGFRGVVTGAVTYLTGCDQVLVQPKCKGENEWVDSRWFDVTRCTLVLGVHKVTVPNAEEYPGADKPAPRR